MTTLLQMNWQGLDSVYKGYNLKCYIITLILNCKALCPVQDEQLLCAAANGETVGKFRTLAARELDPPLFFFLKKNPNKTKPSKPNLIISFTLEIFLLHSSASANQVVWLKFLLWFCFLVHEARVAQKPCNQQNLAGR